MANTTTAKGKERPYKPSWIDRLTHWVENLPVREWVFYVGLGLVLTLSQVFFLWLDGGLQAEALLPVIVYNGLAIPFLLALIHYLDNQAVTALDSMTPTLEMAEPEFAAFRYQLANMPFLATLIAGLIVLAILILIERLATTPIRYAALEQLPTFAVVFQIIDKISAFVFGAFIYHTIRQLRLVNTINYHHVRVNLSNLGPLQAFSKLTASTAVGLVVGIYGWMLINPDLLANRVTLGFVGSVTILAVAVFVWPLFGVHRQIEDEKERALHDIDLGFKAVFAEFNERLRNGDYAAIEGLNEAIAGLEVQHKKTRAIPTWPWRPEVARSALTAIVVPLVLMILQFLLERAVFR